MSTEYGVSSMQIGRWKKTLSDRASELFETGSSMDLEKITDPLYKEIGRLKMDIEWLKKNMEHGYYVHSSEAGVHVSGGGNGLEQPLCSVVGTVEQPGQRILRNGAGGSIEAG